MTTHGGYRQPGRPAPVSGPGALSQRTDGGPGNASQPIRVPTGGNYGEAQALRAQQQAAPLAAGGGPPNPGGPPTAGGPTGPDPFGPSTRPSEPIMMGAPNVSEQKDMEAKELLRVIYAAYPSPWIASLLGG